MESVTAREKVLSMRARTIRELREVVGESQSDLARAIGCSGPQVAAWESGTAPLPAHRRAALARHFGVKPEDIDAPLSQRDRAEAEIARLTAEVDALRKRLAELEAERTRRRRGTTEN
jgi:transcriptional regulator with XRE-family HTH domain